MKIKLPERFTCGPQEWTVREDPSSSDGYFNMATGELVVGAADKDDDPPIFYFSIFLHELLELLFTLYGCRYHNEVFPEDPYLFVFDHKTFRKIVWDLASILIGVRTEEVKNSTQHHPCQEEEKDS